MSLPTHIYEATNKAFGRPSVPQLKVGDTVRVHQKVQEGDKSRVQIFEGIVIAKKHGQGLNGTFTVRRIAAGGVGVEKVFPLHLPSITKVERVKKARVRRSKLYYLRDRAGKGARFTDEQIVGELWQEELDKEVGEAETEPIKEGSEEGSEESKSESEEVTSESKPEKSNQADEEKGDKEEKKAKGEVR